MRTIVLLFIGIFVAQSHEQQAEVERLTVIERRLRFLKLNSEILTNQLFGPSAIKLRFESHADEVQAIALTSEGNIASASIDGTINIWNPLDGSIRQTLKSLVSFPTSLLPGVMTNLVSGLANGNINIWSARGELIKTVKAHDGKISSLLKLSKRDLVSASDDGLIKMWMADGTLIRTLSGHTGPVTKLVLLQNKDFASASADRTIRIWSPSGSLKKTLLGHTDEVTSLVVLKNGDLVSGSRDATIKIWDVESGKMKESLTLVNQPVTALAVLMNGQLASGYLDDLGENIIISDVNGEKVKGLQAGFGWIKGLIVLPNGDLLSVSDEREIKIWTSDKNLPATAIASV